MQLIMTSYEGDTDRMYEGHMFDHDSWRHYIKQEINEHYNDVIMGAMVSQITSVSIVCSVVYLCADQRKHQSSASLAFVRGIRR